MFADWSPGQLAEAVAWIHEDRTPEATSSYDVIAQGDTPAEDPARAWAIVEPWAAAGATSWIEADWEHGTVDAIRRRIQAGPPRP